MVFLGFSPPLTVGWGVGNGLVLAPSTIHTSHYPLAFQLSICYYLHMKLEEGKAYVIDCYGGPACIGVLERDSGYIHIIVLEFRELEHIGEQHWLPESSIGSNLLYEVEEAEICLW